MSAPCPQELSRTEAWRRLVSHLGLTRQARARGKAGVRQVLGKLRCIQLDPLDTIGTNADLVALARVKDIERGDVYQHLLPGHAFEHFAKERCLLPAEAFPEYRDQAAETPWWRLSERMQRLDHGLVDDVLGEVQARGPVSAAELQDRGRVQPMDWSGWRGTPRATTMALEVLWTRCQIVVSGRRGREKLFDVPERALPTVAEAPPRGDFARYALLERVKAAGLLTTAGGPQWSMLRDARTDGTVDALIEEGALVAVKLEGSTRRYLASPEMLGARIRPPDDRMRILGPLDPVLWDRKLVQHCTGFGYVWEVYKPREQRRFGYYVCPLLHRGRLVGRLTGKVTGSVLRVGQVWEEEAGSVDRASLSSALAEHAQALGAEAFTCPSRFRANPRAKAGPTS